MGYVVNIGDDGVIHYSENGKEFFSVAETINEKKDQIELILSGSFRSEVVSSVQDELLALASLNKDILIDMQKLSYISNAAQESLLLTQQHMDATRKGSFVLINLPQKIYDDFDRIGLTQLLEIE